MTKKCQKQAEAKRDGVKTLKITISVDFITVNFDALKRYESTEVDRRTWLHVPSGTLWSTSSDTHQVVEYKKRLLLRCIHHFKPDLINNMDHMRISGTEA